MTSNETQLDLDIVDDAAAEGWEAVLELARERAGKATFESWIRDLFPLSLADGVLAIGAPSAFKREWVEKKYTQMLADCAEAAFGRKLALRFLHATAPRHGAIACGQSPEAATAPPPRAPATPRVPDDVFFGTLPLNSRYTFETFVVGQSNRLAHAGATATAERPGGAFNPLFLWGGAGLGKTHLMQAIGHAVKRANPSSRVAYLSGEAFTTQYVAAIRDRKMDDFRRRFRYADVWLVDDIQFIANKERTEEEFFHTFNALRETGKQVILSSDRAPKDLRLDERLRSRFEAGLIADICAPDLETREAILQTKALREGATIPDDVLRYMANLIRSNIRVLEGALIKLLAYASVTRCPITQQLADEVLGPYFTRQSDDRAISPDEVKRLVAESFGVSVADINGKSRQKPIVLARQVCMYLLRELTDSSLPEIGREFGGKDHSTVIHACQKVRTLLQNDLELSRLIAGMADRLQPRH